MIPIITSFLKLNGFLNKSICINCKHSTTNLVLCSYNPKITKDYLDGENLIDYRTCKKQNKNGNCPFFEEKL